MSLVFLAIKRLGLWSFKPMFICFCSLFFISACTKSESKSPFVFKTTTQAGNAAKIDDLNITDAELIKGIESDIYEEESKIFDMKMQRVKEILKDRLIALDTRAKGMTKEEFLQKHIYKKVEEKEIEDFIKERGLPKEQITPDIKERIRTLLQTEKDQKTADAWINSVMDKKVVEIYFKKPERPKFKVDIGSAPLKGVSSAPISIVEFSDLQCPHCAKGHELVGKLIEKYKDKVSVAFKNFPLPFHTQAKAAAIATLCVHEQSNDAYWKLVDILFKNQNKLEITDIAAHVNKLGIDNGKYSDCVKGNKFEAKVDADLEQGKILGVKSTPTLFINGKIILGAQPIEVVSEIIDEDLAALK